MNPLELFRLVGEATEPVDRRPQASRAITVLASAPVHHRLPHAGLLTEEYRPFLEDQRFLGFGRRVRLTGRSAHAVLDRFVARAVPGVLAVEKLRVRRMGIEQIVEIYVEVNSEETVCGGHAIAHAVKNHLVRRIPSISDVVVHVEPYGGSTT